MKSKIAKKYIYEGLGFPIKLFNVEMVKIDSEWEPKIDVRKVAKAVLKLLPFQSERLTGNQIHFVRTFFEMSLRKFAKEVVRESHMAVSKWEKFGNRSTNMDENTEIMLRLYIFERVCVTTAKQKQVFYNHYQDIKSIELLKKKPDIQVDAA